MVDCKQKKIIRVFPTITKATPRDELAYFSEPDMFVPDDIDEVHISVLFTWDRKRARELEVNWSHIAPVKIGGPGWDDTPSGEFIPGKYVKKGYVITSRGCKNKCWHCSVWKREPFVKELKIYDGNILQDDNILACSKKHIKNVFKMLNRQKLPAHLRGLEAKLFKEWHLSEILNLRLKPKTLWFAYDTKDDYEPLVAVGKILVNAGISKKVRNCYVLCGYSEDTFEKAKKRFLQTWRAGFYPFAMLYRDEDGFRDPEWIRFVNTWSRPAAYSRIIKKDFK